MSENLPLESIILERVYKAIFDYTFEERRNGIHVTSIAWPCDRAMVFDQTLKEKPFGMQTTLRLWIGKCAHTTPIFSDHELEVEWKPDDGLPVVGTVDEYDEKLKLVVEKKSIWKLPSEVLDHHKKQAEYYAAILTEMGKPVENIAWLYFTISPVEFKVFTDVYTKERHKHVLEEILEKKRKLEFMLANNIIPPRTGMKENWNVCRYCPYWYHCLSLED